MESKEVIIQLVDEDRLIEVPAGMSIKEAALLTGVKLIHSCLKAYVREKELERKNTLDYKLLED
jgi:hypothetical protein